MIYLIMTNVTMLITRSWLYILKDRMDNHKVITVLQNNNVHNLHTTGSYEAIFDRSGKVSMHDDVIDLWHGIVSAMA